MIFSSPRNYAFFRRLPTEFKITVLSTGNKIENGQWYLVDINGHQLNLLSETNLTIGESFFVRKDHNLRLIRIR